MYMRREGRELQTSSKTRTCIGVRIVSEWTDEKASAIIEDTARAMRVRANCRGSMAWRFKQS